MSIDTKRLFILASKMWEQGSSKKAFALFSEAAEEGDAGAQLNLGHFYETGEAVRKNAARALYWYKRAWHNGQQTSACSNIADLYAKAGKARLARFWWRRAIDNGDGDAALDLAKYLIKCRHPDERQVARLLRVAAKSKRISPAGANEARVLVRRFPPRRRQLIRALS